MSHREGGVRLDERRGGRDAGGPSAQMRHARRAAAFIFPAACALALSVWHNLSPLQALDAHWLAGCQRYLPGPAGPSPVGFVEVDSLTVDRFGWPVPRERYAALVRLLDRAGARAVVFTMLFKRGPAPAAGDRALAAAMATAGNVYLVYLMAADPRPRSAPAVATVPPTLAGMLEGDLETLAPSLAEAASVDLPAPDLCRAAAALGHDHCLPNAAGRFDTATLLIACDGRLCPALSFVVAADVRGKRPRRVLGISATRLVTDALSVPTTSPATAMVRLSRSWRQRHDATSMLALLKTPRLAERFRSKVVVIGPTTPGGAELLLTPVGPLPGSVVTAAEIEGLVSGRVVCRSEATGPALLALLAAYGLLLAARARRWTVSSLAAAGVVVLVLGCGLLALAAGNIWLPVAPALAAGLLVYGATVSTRLEAVRSLLGWMFGEEVASELEYQPQSARTVQCSIAMVDLGGYSDLSARNSLDDTTELVMAFRELAAEAVHAAGGIITNYAGDSVLAVFEAQGDADTHAERAVRAASYLCGSGAAALTDSMGGATSTIIRAGVATGTVRLGVVPTRQWAEYTVIGDPVNIASRLQGLCKDYDTRILIAGATYESLDDPSPWVLADERELPGRPGSERLYAFRG